MAGETGTACVVQVGKAMKICIYGAGAVGGHLAARLARGGADVSVIARPAISEAIRANGLRVVTPDGDMHVRVTAASEARQLGAQDVVIVTAKAPALPEVAKGLALLLGAHTAVVFAMNGIPWWYFQGREGPMGQRRLPLIDPGDVMWNAVETRRVVGAVVNTACEVLEPGVVRVTNRTNRLVLGEPDGTEFGPRHRIGDGAARRRHDHRHHPRHPLRGLGKADHQSLRRTDDGADANAGGRRI